LTPWPTFDLIIAWAAAVSALPWSLLDTCRIVSLHHRKNKETPAHEFLLATLSIRSAGGNEIRHLLVQRRSADAASAFLRLLGRGTLAEDSISISPSPFTTDASYSLYHLHFPKANRPNILEFAAMLEAIISLDPYYRLYTSDCYWFARMVFEGMARAFDGQVVDGDRPHRRGRFAAIFPVLRNRGIPYVGMSSVMRHWMTYQAAVVRVAAPGVDVRVALMHELIDNIYSRRRSELYALASKAEDPGIIEEPEEEEAGLHLQRILAIALCCISLICLLPICL